MHRYYPAHVPWGYAGPEESAAEEDAGETAEQYMMRRIKTWNVAVRQRPHELQLWLDFAAFQDEISKCARVFHLLCLELCAVTSIAPGLECQSGLPVACGMLAVCHNAATTTPEPSTHART